jgi:hypothetical protein
MPRTGEDYATPTLFTALHCTQLSHHQPSTYKVYRLSNNTMASTPITASTSSNFEAIINGALTKYASQTGHDLRNHPLASEIDRCDSAESILVIFQEQAKAFHEFRNDDPKLIKYLQPVVSGLYILSASPALSTSVSLVSPSNFFCYLTVFSMVSSCRCFPQRRQFFPGSVSFYPYVPSTLSPLALLITGITRRPSPLGQAMTPLSRSLNASKTLLGGS